MKKIIQVACMATMAVSVAMAGKNVAPAESPVIPVLSPSPFYIGLGGIMTSLDKKPCPCNPGIDSDHRYGAILRIGADYNQYFGVEFRALKTLEKNVFSEVTHYGIYLKPQYHLTKQLNVYGLLGYGKTKIDYACKKSNTDENGIAYGIGLEYDLSSDKAEGGYDRTFDGQGNQEKGFGVWVDYSRLLKDKGPVDSTVDLVTAGVTYDF